MCEDNFLSSFMDSLWRVRNKIIYVISGWAVFAHSSVILFFLLNIKNNPLAYKQFSTQVHTSFYIYLWRFTNDTCVTPFWNPLRNKDKILISPTQILWDENIKQYNIGVHFWWTWSYLNIFPTHIKPKSFAIYRSIFSQQYGSFYFLVYSIPICVKGCVNISLIPLSNYTPD